MRFGADGAGWRRRRWVPAALPGPRAAPFTYCYLAVLLAGSLYQALGPPERVHLLLSDSSSDAANLLQRPEVALAASAMWMSEPTAVWPAYLVVFLLTVAQLERRLGWLRTLAVFAAGHVAATLATEVPIALAVATGGLAPGALHRIDLGVSYGVLACLGALAALVPIRQQGRLVGVGIAAVLAASVFGDSSVAAIGHPLAYLVGVLLWPTVRRWAVHRQVVLAQSEQTGRNNRSRDRL
jgi:hypothetical protein